MNGTTDESRDGDIIAWENVSSLSLTLSIFTSRKLRHHNEVDSGVNLCELSWWVCDVCEIKTKRNETRSSQLLAHVGANIHPTTGTIVMLLLPRIETIRQPDHRTTSAKKKQARWFNLNYWSANWLITRLLQALIGWNSNEKQNKQKIWGNFCLCRNRECN